jgi:hypothetical protein
VAFPGHSERWSQEVSSYTIDDGERLLNEWRPD